MNANVFYALRAYAGFEAYWELYDTLEEAIAGAIACDEYLAKKSA